MSVCLKTAPVCSRWLTVWAMNNRHLQWTIEAVMLLDFCEQQKFHISTVKNKNSEKSPVWSLHLQVKVDATRQQDNDLLFSFSTVFSIDIYSQWPDWQLWENLRPWVQLHGKGVEYESDYGPISPEIRALSLRRARPQRANQAWLQMRAVFSPLPLLIAVKWRLYMSKTTCGNQKMSHAAPVSNAQVVWVQRSDE